MFGVWSRDLFFPICPAQMLDDMSTQALQDELPKCILSVIDRQLPSLRRALPRAARPVILAMPARPTRPKSPSLWPLFWCRWLNMTRSRKSC